MRVPERRPCNATGGRRNAPQEDSAAEAPAIREELVASRHPMRPEGDPHPVIGLEVRLPDELRSRTVQRVWLLVAAGGTGEQVIVVLDGTRDTPGTCVWRPPSSSAGPDGQAAAVAAGLPVRTWLIRDSDDDTSDGS